jgi:hypothetical protein
MKTTYYISIFLILLTGIVSCGKNKTTTVSGRLMQSCDTPAANKDALIHINGGGILAKPIVTLDFTTDENGYFSVTHDESFHRFSVMTSNSFSVLDVDNYDVKNKELGEVYIIPPKASYYLYLDVKNSYTVDDTLTFNNGGWPHDGREPWIKKSGPFQTGIIDTVHFLSHINDLPIWSFNNKINDSFPTKQVHYYINEYESENEKLSSPFSASYCNDEYQTVTLVID